MTKSKAAKAAQKQRLKTPLVVGSAQPKKPKSKAKKAKSVSFRGAKMMPIGPGPTGSLGLRIGGNLATTRRSQVIEEDEYVADVMAGANTFNVTQYACNPGQQTLFPWGNRIAQLYEKYVFDYLEFYYKREVSEFATLGTTGKVILSFDYDASDSAPSTKQQMEDTVPHSDGMPSTPVIRLPIDCACMRDSPARYVRPGAQPANTDIKTYDVGNLNVATYGLASTSGAIGELRVRYRVRFSEPVLEASSQVSGAMHFSSITPTSANNFAGAVLQSGSTPFMSGINLTTSNTVTFPAGIPGNYLILVNLAAATSAGALALSALAGGASGLNLATSSAARNATFGVASNSGTTTAPSMVWFSITVTAAGGTVAFTPGTLVTSGTGSLDVFVFSLPSTVLTVREPVGRNEIDELRDQVGTLSRLVKSRFTLSAHAGDSSDGEDSLLECKETDLRESVHISQSVASKLLRAVGGR